MPEALPFPTAHVRFGSSSGQPLTRRDGQLKVTGAATFAADNHPAGMLHAVVATSTIARGRVASLDVAAAKAHPGVVEVITSANRPPLSLDPAITLILTRDVRRAMTMLLVASALRAAASAPSSASDRRSRKLIFWACA